MTNTPNLSIRLGLLTAVAILGGSPAVAGIATPACAFCSYPTVNYTFTGLSYDVTNILVFAESDTFHDNVIDKEGFFSAPAGTSTISGLFGTAPIVSTFMIGVTNEVPGEPGGSLVLFTNDTFAANNSGNDFNSIFSQLLNYTYWYTDHNVAIDDYSFTQSIASESNPANGETTLIADLLAPGAAGMTLPNGLGFGGSLDVGHFVAGESPSVGSAGPGAIASAGFAPGESFTAIAFSNGQIIGQGTSVLVPAPVPEPVSWMMMLTGVFGVGAMLRGAGKRAGSLAGPGKFTATS